ncbi:histamine H4 receptor-like [Diadema antillarum]|uniref:histamine H4 receptor-like n=1 Tax=Diadema antillarum TaxID=105358 RepID=UPI003A8B6B82
MNRTSQVSSPSDFEVYKMILICSSYGALIGLTVVGNLLVILAFSRDPHIREHAANHILLHLSVADFLVGSVSLPFDLVQYLNGHRWIFGKYSCVIWMFIDYTATTLSVALIVCASFDRYWIVSKSIKYRVFQSRKRVDIMIVSSWLIVLTLFSVVILGLELVGGANEQLGACEANFHSFPTVASLVTIVVGYLPFIVVTALNILMYISLWRQAQKFVRVRMRSYTMSTEDAAEKRSGRQRLFGFLSHHPKVTVVKGTSWTTDVERPGVFVQHLNFRRNARSAKKLSLLVGLFALCWMPYEFVAAYESFCHDYHVCVSSSTWRVVAFLQWANSALNPIFYAVSNARFRENFKRFFFLRF